jgi:hypothetical protein
MIADLVSGEGVLGVRYDADARPRTIHEEEVVVHQA